LLASYHRGLKSVPCDFPWDCWWQWSSISQVFLNIRREHNLHGCWCESNKNSLSDSFTWLYDKSPILFFIIFLKFRDCQDYWSFSDTGPEYDSANNLKEFYEKWEFLCILNLQVIGLKAVITPFQSVVHVLPQGLKKTMKSLSQ
jgi:hypothetical protein